MKTALFVLAVAPTLVQAQSPDVAPFVELRPTWQIRSTKKSLFHWYDLSGRFSLVGFRMILENGLRVYGAQRFEKVDNSGDPDTMDEYYIENRGNWRVGKQYLPFGRREILRSTVLAARLDTHLLLDQAPISVALFDAGSGRTRGIMARIGGVVGISAASGNHLGIQATDFAHFQDLEQATGIERGHRLAFGADTQISFGGTQLTAEWVSLRRGETALDKDRDLSDVRMRLRLPETGYVAVLSWSRDWTSREDTNAIELNLQADEHFSYVPFVRFDGLAFRDFGLSAVVRF